MDDLFNPDGTIKDTTTQDDINNAQDAVNKLLDGDLKDELQDRINEAQKQLDDRKETPIVKPSTKPMENGKPSVSGGSSTIENASTSVKTNDETNIQLYIGLLCLSLVGFTLVSRKRKEIK